MRKMIFAVVLVICFYGLAIADGEGADVLPLYETHHIKIDLKGDSVGIYRGHNLIAYGSTEGKRKISAGDISIQVEDGDIISNRSEIPIRFEALTWQK